MTKLLDRMTFYVLPVFNVDGYIWSWTQVLLYIHLLHLRNLLFTDFNSHVLLFIMFKVWVTI